MSLKSRLRHPRVSIESLRAIRQIETPLWPMHRNEIASKMLRKDVWVRDALTVGHVLASRDGKTTYRTTSAGNLVLNSKN